MHDCKLSLSPRSYSTTCECKTIDDLISVVHAALDMLAVLCITITLTHARKSCRGLQSTQLQRLLAVQTENIRQQ